MTVVYNNILKQSIRQGPNYIFYFFVGVGVQAPFTLQQIVGKKTLNNPIHQELTHQLQPPTTPLQFIKKREELNIYI